MQTLLEMCLGISYLFSHHVDEQRQTDLQVEFLSNRFTISIQVRRDSSRKSSSLEPIRLSSGRTECQTTALGNLTSRNVNNFERKASHRFSRRASYAIRKKIQDQEIQREQEEERVRKLKTEQEAKLDEQKKTIE